MGGERIRKCKIIRDQEKEASQGNTESVTNKNEERRASVEGLAGISSPTEVPTCVAPFFQA